MAIDYVKILPKHLDAIDLNQAENIIEHKSGSGPFILNEYQRGNFYKVSKNPNYFKEGRPFFDSIDHFITAGWGGFFWPQHRDFRGFQIPKTVQYGFKHEDLWLDR